VHQLPQISDGNLSLARREVESAVAPPQRRLLSDDEALKILRSATERVHAPAVQVCTEMNVGECDWQFQALRDSSMNAGAGPDGWIFVNRGIVEYAANEEEVCLVIAHEMGHQAASHVATGQRNQAVGALIGAALLGAAAVVASRGSYNGAALTRQATETGASIGGAVGRLSYSKEQEREADYLAAVILYRAGVDLDKARGFLVTLARASGRREAGMLDSHPAGPERIAGWDRAVAEIRASKGRLPQRA
jgi:predicted Zn-dependent protease